MFYRQYNGSKEYCGYKNNYGQNLGRIIANRGLIIMRFQKTKYEYMALEIR